MNNWQLLVSAGFPTLAVLIGILMNRTDSARLDARLTSVEGRLDARLTSVEGRLDARLTSVDNRLDRRLDTIEKDLKDVRHDLSEFYRIQSQHELRLDGLEKSKG